MKTCPICQSPDIVLFKKNISIGHDLMMCNSCNVSFSNPFKEPSAEFYTNAEDAASEYRHEKIRSLPTSHPAYNCEQLNNGSGLKLLDLGCGNGEFIDFATKIGFSCYGLDIDKKSIEKAKLRNINAHFENGFINDISRFEDYPQKYDVITMFEVFEHIDNPLEMIEKIKNLLNEGGYFIGSLPNIERFFMWQFNMDFERPPYHLTYWTIRSWKNFLESKQFELIDAKNNSYFGYISDVLSNKFSSKNNFIGQISRNFFGVTKYFIEAPIEKALTNGASFFFVAKKIGI